ncbi:hypothetical protein KSP40_PGU005907 [Platanthera guangdongensis]|uniref:Uncharacterized protein n=1 Tax=Platanthera guangdongensis TaxID=2320717 RepID=A0ABR2N182_9ASPA
MALEERTHDEGEATCALAGGLDSVRESQRRRVDPVELVGEVKHLDKEWRQRCLEDVDRLEEELLIMPEKCDNGRRPPTTGCRGVWVV